MKATQQPDTEELLRRAGTGDPEARQQLLARHRGRLRQMVALRIDRRMAARVDPSDVVQEALADAAQSLSDYLKNRPLPFYPWLRQFAWERLLQLHRHHLQAQRRSVSREQLRIGDVADESAAILAERLADSGAVPAPGCSRPSCGTGCGPRSRPLEPRDREVLVLRYLEQLSTQGDRRRAGHQRGGGEDATSPGPGAAAGTARRVGRVRGDEMSATLDVPLRPRFRDDQWVRRPPRRRDRGVANRLQAGERGGLRGDPGAVSRARRVAAPAAAGDRGDGRLRGLRQPAGGVGRIARLEPARRRAGRRWATSASSARSAAAAWGSSTRPSRSRWAAGWP